MRLGSIEVVAVAAAVAVPAAAAPIPFLARELSYASGAALKKQTNKQTKNKQTNKKNISNKPCMYHTS